MKKRMKKFESGGIASAADKYSKEYEPVKKRKPLPSETIKEDKNAKAVNEGVRDTIIETVKGAPAAAMAVGKKLYENVMGTKAQNEAADAREAARARANPEGNEAKFRDFMGKEYKKGGKVSSASKRADGCAQRGKTKGRMV